jgi:hypothetical protein
MLSSLHADGLEAADELEADDPESLTAAVLRIHAGAGTASARSGCCRVSPAPIRTCRSSACRRAVRRFGPEALRAIADQITGEASAA